MGYDITSYVPKAAPDDPRSVALPEREDMEPIGFLEMGARSSDARSLFAAFGAEEYDGEVSGTGIGRYFTHEQLDYAFRQLCQYYVEGRTSARIIRFVAQTVERLSDRPWVYIEFA